MIVPDEIHRALRERGVRSDDLILCAVSGGADSVSLAAAVSAAGFRRLRLAWINHNLRPVDETSLDFHIVEGLAERLAVPLDRKALAEGEIEARARAAHQSIEQVARQLRYEALGEIAARWAQDESSSNQDGSVADRSVYLLTAHHHDDQAETVLSRIADGHPSTVPLAIPGRRILAKEPVKVVLVRPALDLSGQSLRRWGAGQGLTWNEDSTNRDVRYRRNALRLRVLPSLSELLPNSSQMIARYGTSHDRLVSGLRELIPVEAKGRYTRASWVVAREAFLRLPESARELVLRDASYELSASRRLPSGFLTEILRRIQRSDRDGSHMEVSGSDLVCEATDTDIRLTRDVVPAGQRGYLWPVFAGYSFDLNADASGLYPTRVSKTPSVEGRRVAVTSISFPAILRDYRPGDGILWSGRFRTIPDVARRRNVSRNVRRGAAILESCDGIEAAFWPGWQCAVRDGRTWSDDGVNYQRSAVIFRIRG